MRPCGRDHIPSTDRAAGLATADKKLVSQKHPLPDMSDKGHIMFHGIIAHSKEEPAGSVLVLAQGMLTCGGARGTLGIKISPDGRSFKAEGLFTGGAHDDTESVPLPCFAMNGCFVRDEGFIPEVPAYSFIKLAARAQ